MTGERGFTLLELLISMTILAVVATLIFGALRLGIRAWEKGEESIEYNQRTRIVLDIMKRQIASACVEKNTLFMGDGENLSFYSLVSIVPENGFGKVFVKYSVKSGQKNKRLAVFETSAVLPGKKAVEPDDADFHSLVPEARQILFEYSGKTGSNEQTPSWRETWDSQIEKGFPAAVRIVIETSDGKGPVSVAASIESR